MKKKLFAMFILATLALTSCNGNNKAQSSDFDSLVESSSLSIEPTQNSSQAQESTQAQNSQAIESSTIQSSTEIIHIRNDKKELFISEYGEGSSENRYIELFNPTADSIDLSEYTLELYTNGETEVKNEQKLTGTLASNTTYVIASSHASSAIKNKANITSNVCNFNGDDVIVLKYKGVIIDIIGEIGQRPTDGFLAGDGSTLNHTLIRKDNVTYGSNVFLKSDWVSYDSDYLTNLGSHSIGGSNVTPNPTTTTTSTSTEVVPSGVITDLKVVYDLINGLTPNDKGTVYGSEIKVHVTAIASVEEETKLFYVSDGSYIIKAHGEKLHNYLEEGNEYEIKCKYSLYQYIPSLEIANPQSDVKSLGESKLDELDVYETELSEIYSMKKENPKANISNDVLCRLLTVEAYLVYDDHNSRTPVFCLVDNLNYKKNNTQYILDGVYFKNSAESLASLVNYCNKTITVTVLIYDWNPDRKDWRIYLYSVEE